MRTSELNPMKKGIFGILLLLFLCMTGCTKDVDDESSLLGSWTEEAPVEGRTALYFAQNNELHLTKSGTTEVFNYSIEGNTLYLSKNGLPGESGEFFIELIGQNRLKVENLYVSIPEEQPTYIIFRRN